MDREDKLLALQLQLDDLNLFDGTFDPKGKRKAGDVPDNEVALHEFKTQLQAAVQQILDASFAHSFARALDVEADILRQHMCDEAQATTDRRLARRLSGHTDAEAPPTPLDAVTSNAASVAGPSNSSSSDSNPSPTSSSASSKGNACVCCGDEALPSELIHAPCADAYCVDCLKELFVRSTKDESLVPPRCCRQDIPFDRIADHLSNNEAHGFTTANFEFTTPNRTYCADPTCGVFILPNNVYGDVATCQTCDKVTCAICKQTGHDGDCPEDTNIHTTLALATDNNWRRCGNCQRMVELSLGCNHITMCYLCGVPWKQCLCEQFTERYLLTTVENIVDREANGATEPVVRRQRVHQVQQELRDRHDCRHSRHFEKIDVEGRHGSTCDTCGFRMYKFLLRCRFCHLEVCAFVLNVGVIAFDHGIFLSNHTKGPLAIKILDVQQG